jgi:DNA mismatch repair protein MutS2
VRDKRYWEQKRQTVHQREKDVEKTITRYETNIEEIDKERKAILRRAKEQAEEPLREANRKIENTIREIREAAAEKERTRQLREELNDFRQEVREIDTTEKDAAIEKKMQQIRARRERKAKRKQEKASGSKIQVSGQGQNQEPPKPQELSPIEKLMKKFNEGDTSFDVKVTQKSTIAAMADAERANKSSMTRKVIEEHTRNFSHEIDVRGLRGDEALLKVQHFVDDAILIGVSQVRILHGKGNGILRSLIRDYLNALPNVLSCRDEHVQFGGAGITVVELG